MVCLLLSVWLFVRFWDHIVLIFFAPSLPGFKIGVDFHEGETLSSLARSMLTSDFCLRLLGTPAEEVLKVPGTIYYT